MFFLYFREQYVYYGASRLWGGEREGSMQTLILETVIHLADGKTEVYYERGETPHAIEVLQERLKYYPNGRKELFQHGDGLLRDTPPKNQ